MFLNVSTVAERNILEKLKYELYLNWVQPRKISLQTVIPRKN